MDLHSWLRMGRSWQRTLGWKKPTAFSQPSSINDSPVQRLPPIRSEETPQRPPGARLNGKEDRDYESHTTDNRSRDCGCFWNWVDGGAFGCERERGGPEEYRTRTGRCGSGAAAD